MARGEQGPAAWLSSRGLWRRSRARASPAGGPVRYGLEARLGAVGCLRGRRAVAFRLRKSLSAPFFRAARRRALACFLSSSTRMCSAAAPSRNARRGTWVGGAADGRGARARGSGSLQFHSRGRCVVYSPRRGLSGATRVACDAAHVRAYHPLHRPAPQGLFGCARFFSQWALKSPNPLAICIAPGSLRLFWRHAATAGVEMKRRGDRTGSPPPRAAPTTQISRCGPAHW